MRPAPGDEPNLGIVIPAFNEEDNVPGEGIWFRARPSRRRLDITVCTVVVLACGLYLAAFFRHGWLPWDDGLLAETAQRVLDGQLPHRDFDDLYTGGLSFLHAGVFRLVGPSLGALRDTLFAAALLTVPVWYWVSRRFAPPAGAAVLTFVCFAWSVPNYPASMPSWYTSFLAVAAAAATLRYVEARQRRWLVLAGIAAGTSTIIKITGVYAIAAIAVFILYQSLDERPARRPLGVALGGLTVLSCVLGSTLPFVLTSAAHSQTAAVELALPPAVLTVAVSICALRALRQGWVPSREVIEAFLAFMIGIAAPVLAFMIPFFPSHSTAALLHGVLVSPQKRLVTSTTNWAGPPLFVILLALPLLHVLTAKRYAGGAVKLRYAALAVTACLIGDRLLAHLGWRGPMWYSVSLLMAPLAIVVAWAVVAHEADARVLEQRGTLVLLSLVAAWCALIQFPFNAPIYFSYVAPLVILSAVAASRALRGPAAALDGALLAAYLAIAVALRSIQDPVGPLVPQTAAIPSQRGGIFVSKNDSAQYGQVLATLAAHAHSPYLLATPDIPEVYFLSGLRNPTRTLYELFDDTTDRDRRILRAVDSVGVTAIVINVQPAFSAPLAGQLHDSLTKRFPAARYAGQFEIRWR